MYNYIITQFLEKISFISCEFSLAIRIWPLNWIFMKIKFISYALHDQKDHKSHYEVSIDVL